MIQAAPVLPSNGSPLLNADNGRTSRVLQEQSNNRQHTDYPYVDGSEQKYASLLLSENNYPAYHQHQPRHDYQQTALQRNRNRHISSGHHFSHGSHDARARADRQASLLYRRFQASDQYMKYRNRQQKDDKNGQEQKWPDRLEEAFFKALVWWPPMGRRQLPHKDKRRGRNELIADFIEELTGESRTRKQVSSHIQVLKPFVEHDAEIMKWLSKEDMGARHLHHAMYGGRAASYHYSGRRASCYPATVPGHAAPAPTALLTSANSYELSKAKEYLAVFEPTEFQMFVQRKHADGIERLHDYTVSVSTPRQEDEKPEDLASFTQSYPFAASLLSYRRPDCNVVLAEASLAFPAREFKDEAGKPLKGVELGISFLCKSGYLDVNANVVCRNTFYKNGEPFADENGPSKVAFTHSEDNHGIETQLKFGSTFWARQLAFLANRLRENDETGKSVDEVREYIKNITAYQEVFITTEQGHERLLVVCWSFRLSRDFRGKASWRRLRLPTQSAPEFGVQPKTERVDSVYDYNLDFTGTTSSTVQPALQSPFEYDSSSGGSTLPSATWPSTFDTNDGANAAPHSAIDFTGSSDNAFDFSGGNINISYTDPSIMDFSNFDSSAFNFDTTGDFVADPALQNYGTQEPQDSFQSTQSQDYSQQSQPEYSQQSQHDYSQQTDYSSQWCDSYTAFDSQQNMTAGAVNYASGSDSHNQVFHGLPGHYEHHGYHEGPADGQAYGGAGQDVHGREDDPLSAIADASYMRHVSLPAQHDEQHQTQ